jgi:hypothetical protein
MCVCYLENHVFIGTRIDRSIAACHVLNRRCKTARLFQLFIAKQFLHRGSSRKAAGTASENLTRISRSGRLKLHAASSHQHHYLVAHSVLNDDAHVAKTAALAVGNNSVALCPIARLL